MESFPPELEESVPLKMKSVIRYCDKLGPHYQAVGCLLGLSDTVRCLKSGNDTLPNKMIQILDEWIETGKATWSTLVLGLERNIPCLRGLASEIRKDLREELEKRECVFSLQSVTECTMNMYLYIHVNCTVMH